jgi:glycosyltransferase involved in cell wall biosynthesis
MKIAFVSPFPPSKVTLNEYGYHLIKGFIERPEVEKIYVLTNHLEDNASYAKYALNGVKILPCWHFDSITSVYSIIAQLRSIKADVVILNLQFMTFGEGKIAAALGLLTPWLAKLFGIPSIVLLHNITETVKLETIGMSQSKWKTNLYLWIGTQLTKFILKANVVGLTISQYVSIVKEKSKAENVVLLPHGNFELPERVFLPENLKTINLMAFGKFGTYKKVEVMIEATKILNKKFPHLEIIATIAGTDNPNVKGYLESVQINYGHMNNLRFLGYIPEEKVAEVFQDSTFIIFPYTTTTGSSGILHQAGSYARACILPKIDDLERVVNEEGYSGAYFETDNAESMAKVIGHLIDNPGERRMIENQNFAAAKGLPMTDLADMYIKHAQKLLNTNPIPTYEKELDTVFA